MIRTTGIICKPIKEMVSTAVPPLMAWLAARGVSSYLDQQTATTVGAHDRGLRRDEMGGKIDWLIVLGGDGTLLSAARAMGPRPRFITSRSTMRSFTTTNGRTSFTTSSTAVVR